MEKPSETSKKVTLMAMANLGGLFSAISPYMEGARIFHTPHVCVVGWGDNNGGPAFAAYLKDLYDGANWEWGEGGNRPQTTCLQL